MKYGKNATNCSFLLFFQELVHTHIHAVTVFCSWNSLATHVAKIPHICTKSQNRTATAQLSKNRQCCRTWNELIKIINSLFGCFRAGDDRCLASDPSQKAIAYAGIPTISKANISNRSSTPKALRRASLPGRIPSRLGNENLQVVRVRVKNVQFWECLCSPPAEHW